MPVLISVTHPVAWCIAVTLVLSQSGALAATFSGFVLYSSVKYKQQVTFLAIIAVMDPSYTNLASAILFQTYWNGHDYIISSFIWSFLKHPVDVAMWLMKNESKRVTS